MALITTPFGARLHRRRGGRRHRPEGPPRDRHGRRFGHRHRDRPRAGRRRRRGHARRPRRRGRRAHRRRHHRHHRQRERARRAPRPRRPGIDRAPSSTPGTGPLHLLVNNAGVMATPRAAHARGLGAAVRDQPPRPLRARRRAARRTRCGRRRAHRRRSARSATAARRWCSTTSTSSGARTSRGRPTASPRRPTCCSPSRPRGAGPSDGITANALMPGGDHDQPPALRRRGRPGRRGRIPER